LRLVHPDSIGGSDGKKGVLEVMKTRGHELTAEKKIVVDFLAVTLWKRRIVGVNEKSSKSC